MTRLSLTCRSLLLAAWLSAPRAQTAWERSQLVDDRTWHAMAYDPLRQATILCGGVSQSGSFDDTWEWAGSAWRLRDTGNRPSARDQHAMAFDPIRGQLVL